MEMKQARLLKKARLNSSQDGIVFGTDGIGLTQTAGHEAMCATNLQVEGIIL